MFLNASRSLCAFFLVLLSLYAALLGYHEFRAHVIWKDISFWDQTGAIDNGHKLAENKLITQNLTSRFPWHADFHFLAAKVHEWLAFLQRLSPRQVQIHQQHIFIHLVDAINARPYSGRAWGALLNLNSRDPLASSHQLKRALRLGRYDIDTQYYLIRYLFKNWHSFSNDQQSELIPFLRERWNNAGRARNYFLKMQRNYPKVDLTSLIKEP
jgi:hypothetical protein